MSRVPPRHPDLVYPSDYRTDDDDTSPFFICLVVSVVIAIVVVIIAVYVVNDDHSQDTEDVILDIEQYGGTIYLDEATGSGAMSLVSWYVPQDSNVRVTGDYIHIDKAKSYAYSSQTYELYIPMQAVAYVSINNH